MKRLFLTCFLLLVSVALWGQYAGVAKRSGTHIKLDGERLTPEQQVALLSDIGGVDYNEPWTRAAKLRNTGLGLTIGGSVVSVAGLATTFIGAVASAFGAAIGAAAGAIGGSIGGEEAAQQGANAGSPYITGGLVATFTGLAATVTGVTLLSVGGTRMRRITDTYNETNRESARLYFGPTASGVGLALQF